MKTLIWLISTVALVTTPYAAAEDLVLIVNRNNPADNVTKAQLRKFVLGEQDSWGALKVNIILRGPGQPERLGVLRSICGMSDDDFNQHLLHASFGGNASGAPKAVATGAAVRQLVMILPGGIGIVNAADVTASVKAVTVDGIAAGQPGYKITTGK
jgi:ABC-type phosphate transport system substrate-binding protein